VLFFLSATNLYAQAQVQPQPQPKEVKTDLRTFSDNTNYENANQFYKLKQFSLATELFTEYLEIYPNGLHRKEVYKKIALMHFEKFDYIKSIKTYNSLYEEYSNSEEGIEAFFMTGICYQKMGFLDNAKQVFKSLMEEHPESNYAPQAKTKLDLIEILENS
jgi:TolA-binding protein